MEILTFARIAISGVLFALGIIGLLVIAFAGIYLLEVVEVVFGKMRDVLIRKVQDKFGE